jgi:hypothetical protein
MTLQQIIQQTRTQIAEGRLEEATSQLVRFLDEEWMSKEDRAQIHLYNQALQQLSQMNELREQELSGVISLEDADLKRNKIRAALLTLPINWRTGGKESRWMQKMHSEDRIKKMREGGGKRCFLHWV